VSPEVSRGSGRDALATRGSGWAAATAVIIAAVALAASAGWENFPTADEPYHLLAGWTYAAQGHGDFNPEHPPLTKLCAGLALLPLDLHGARGAPVQRLPMLSLEIRRFLHHNTASAEAITRLGRLAMLPCLVLLLAGVYLWARELFGPPGGLVALVAVASQPLVLGHAFVVHTDVASAATWVWTLRAAQRWFSLGGRRWIAVGAWLGVALLVKFSAVYLALGVALAVLARAWRRRSLPLLQGLAGAGVVAACLIPVGYAPVLRHASAAEVGETWTAYLRGHPETTKWAVRMAGVPLVGKGWVQWTTGLAYVARTNRLGQGINYFFGHTSTTGFWLYFPVALALKVSLPFLALVAAAAPLAVVHRTWPALWPWFGAGYYLLVSLGSSYNIGARHVLPCVVLLGVGAGVVASRLTPIARSGAVAVLAAAPLLSFPSFIAHFNALVGPERGARILADSNVDWGQDWKRAARLAVAARWTPITVVYLGSADPASLFPDGVDFFAAAARARTPYVALSRQAAAVGTDYLTALGEREAARSLAALLDEVSRHGERLAVVGHSIELYRLRPSSAASAFSPAARRLRMSQDNAFDWLTPRTTRSKSSYKLGSLRSLPAVP